MPSLNPAYSKLLGASLGSKVFDPLSHEANQSLDNMVGKSKREKALDFIDAFTKEREQVPSFRVNVKQKGLEFVFPQDTSERFYQDLQRGLPQPGVEKFIYHRLLDENNPNPLI